MLCCVVLCCVVLCCVVLCCVVCCVVLCVAVSFWMEFNLDMKAKFHKPMHFGVHVMIELYFKSLHIQ